MPTRPNVPAVAARAVRQLGAHARPAGDFDASRYFRGDHELEFLNVGAHTVRLLARDIAAERAADWSLDDAMAFAAILIRRRALEEKGLAVELVARWRREFTPTLLPRWKRWLAGGFAANWATTDAICGYLIGPTLLKWPDAARELEPWSRHRVLWVRRASIVGLIPLARRGQALPQVYRTARRLHADPADLMQKAVGWALREAGKTDPVRLEQYLRRHGSRTPRTTLRYAIERFPARLRQRLLAETR